jgi:hypothetical protein
MLDRDAGERDILALQGGDLSDVTKLLRRRTGFDPALQDPIVIGRGRTLLGGGSVRGCDRHRRCKCGGGERYDRARETGHEGGNDVVNAAYGRGAVPIEPQVHSIAATRMKHWRRRFRALAVETRPW